MQYKGLFGVFETWYNIDMTNKTTKNKVGRPTVITEEVLAKLEYAFSIGCTDKEAYSHAKVSKEAFYGYQNNNPKFKEYKEQLKQKPFLKARDSINKGLKDPKIALKYMKYKRSKEFNTKQVIDNNHSGNISLTDMLGKTKGK